MQLLKIKETLVAARVLISKEEHWTRGGGARTESDWCLPNDPGAICWCSLGAIGRAIGTDHGDEALFNDCVEFIRNDGLGGVSMYNDTHTHAEVLARLDLAIARAL